MKRKIAILSALLTAGAISVPSYAQNVTVLVDGQHINSDVPAQIINSRTMLPMRAIFEAQGAEVGFDADTKTVTARKDDTTVSLTIGASSITVNGKTQPTDVAPVIVNSRTLVSARYVSEALGNKVDWDANTKTVTITTGAAANDTVTTPAAAEPVYVNNYTELTNAVKNQGAVVYITGDIKMDGRLALDQGNVSLIGVAKTDGSLPTLDFIDMKGDNDITVAASNDGEVGIRITSAGNTVKNLIIENAHDNGIQLKGENADNNLIENCIVRYSNDSGIQSANGAGNNTLRNVYSYRNCDVFTKGSNADGFAIKLGSGSATTEDRAEIAKNAVIMENCYAWENGDDGWDSYDKEDNKGFWTYDLSYKNCMCWNNGTTDNCLGYTDYANGKQLDERLPFIVRLAKLYPDKYAGFKSAYNSGTFSEKSFDAYLAALDAAFGTVPVQGKDENGEKIVENIAFSALPENWSGNPNGFKLGSKFTPANAVRVMENCIAFDHDKFGFDKNNSGANVSITNSISFNNRANYHLETYTAQKWDNVNGWSVKDKDDLPNGVTVNEPENKAEIEASVRAAANEVMKNAEAGKVVASDIFSKVF